MSVLWFGPYNTALVFCRLSIATSHLEVSVTQFRALLEAVRENLVARVPPVSQSLKQVFVLSGYPFCYGFKFLTSLSYSLQQIIRDQLAISIREWVYRQPPRLMLSYRHLLHEAKQLADQANAAL
jgi:hypothetical protein